MIVIEVTKRYIIGNETLDSIVDTYTEKYKKNDCYNFKEFLAEELENYLEDEKIVNGNYERIRRICQLQIELENEKEKMLS